MKTLYLYEILVPATLDDKEIEVQYHRLWDKKVNKITGGLTIHKSTKGYWTSPEGDLFVEKMIPVRIMCTAEQIKRIADITAEHYKQKAVMFYRISDRVIVNHYT
jgi:hypothetical protein